MKYDAGAISVGRRVGAAGAAGSRHLALQLIPGIKIPVKAVRVDENRDLIERVRSNCLLVVHGAVILVIVGLASSYRYDSSPYEKTGLQNVRHQRMRLSTTTEVRVRTGRAFSLLL